MRIFFITNNYIPYSGGVVQSINAIVDELRKQGHEVYIITLSFLSIHDDLNYVIRIPCPIKFRYKNNYMAIPWRPGKAIDALITRYNPHIIHIHHPFLLGICALKAAKKHHIPCIFTYHTLYHKYAHYVPFIGKYLKSVIENKVKKFCNQVNTIIAPSTAIKHYLQLQDVKTAIAVIPSPLRTRFFANAKKKVEAHSSSFFKLLLVTRFVPEKNIPFIFEVMQLLPDNFHLTLVGYGYDYKKMQKLAFEKLQLSSDCIQFIHKPDEKQLLALYRIADLFIFPSQTDTQGIVLAESMSQGLPVVALDGPGQRDIIINGINGFIVSDAQEMAHIIKKCAYNPLKLKEYATAAQKTAQNYKAAYLMTKIMDVYRGKIHI